MSDEEVGSKHPIRPDADPALDQATVTPALIAMVARLASLIEGLENRLSGIEDRLDEQKLAVRKAAEETMLFMDALTRFQASATTELTGLNSQLASHARDLQSMRDDFALQQAGERIRAAGQREANAPPAELPSGASFPAPSRRSAAEPPSVWRRTYVPH